jgi:hypothetical protein
MRVELNWRLIGSSENKLGALYQTLPSFRPEWRNLLLPKTLSGS